MAGVLFAGNIAPVATGTSAKTLLQLVAAANQRIKVVEWSISFTGTSNTATPIQVDLVRQTTAGTSSPLTLVKLNESDAETLQSTANQNATAEPTTGDNDITEEVHPQTGYTWQAPFGREIIIKGGNRLGIRVTAGASVTAACRAMAEE
jgi:hypothetical protein